MLYSEIGMYIIHLTCTSIFLQFFCVEPCTFVLFAQNHFYFNVTFRGGENGLLSGTPTRRPFCSALQFLLKNPIKNMDARFI